MFGTLLRLQLLAFRRAPYFGGRVVLMVGKSLGLAYAVVGAALLGFLAPDTLSVWAPGVSALGLIEAAMLPALGLLTVARVLFQDVPTRGSEAFLLLPVDRARVARTVGLRSILTVLNVVPLAFALPFAARTVRLEAGAAAAWGFVAGCVALVALSHVALVVWKTRLGERPLHTILLLGGLVAAIAALDIGLGGLISTFRTPEGWVLTAALAVAALGLGAYAYQGIVEALYLDRPAPPSLWTPAPATAAATGFTRPGVRAFVEMDVRQITRTRYPRGILVNAALLGLVLSLVGLLGDSGEPMALLMLFAVSAVAVSAGQFALPFASGHYDRLLTLPGALPAFVRAKLAVLIGTILALGAVQLGVALALLASAPEARSGDLVAIGAGVLFGAGVLAPVSIFGSSIAPKPLDVGDRVMMNYKVQSLPAQIVIGGTSVAAAGLFLLLGPDAGLVALAGLGTASLLAMPLWERLLAVRLQRRRYAISARFRATL